MESSLPRKVLALPLAIFGALGVLLGIYLGFLGVQGKSGYLLVAIVVVTIFGGAIGLGIFLWQQAWKAVAGVIALMTLGLLLVFVGTGGLVNTADDFFRLVNQKEFPRARDYFSESIKSEIDVETLRSFLSRNELLNVSEINWSSRSTSGNYGELSGPITTQAGSTIHVKTIFVKADGDWKIFSIQRLNQDDSPRLPSKSDQFFLVKRSIKDLIISVQEKSSDHLYRSVAQAWKKQLTVAQLNETLAPYFKNETNWAVLERTEPFVEPVTFDSKNNVLSLRGYYPTEPKQVHFELDYLYEGISWELAGFGLSIKKSE